MTDDEGTVWTAVEYGEDGDEVGGD